MTDTHDDVDENVFQVLGRQARTRTSPELWITTVGGLVNAGLIWSEHPALSWLAAGCAATAAYGAWGLLDHAARTRMSATSCGTMHQLTGLRDLTALLGTGAAVWAVMDFMAAALGNWHH